MTWSSCGGGHGLAAFPSVVVVGRDGRIAFRRRGGAWVQVLQAAVDVALRGFER